MIIILLGLSQISGMFAANEKLDNIPFESKITQHHSVRKTVHVANTWQINVGNNLISHPGQKAWCNESNGSVKTKPNKKCIIPFLYNNLVHYGCVKLLEAV